MMEVNDYTHLDDSKILREIGILSKDLNELYNQKGPASSDYITLGLKLNLLKKQYFETLDSIPFKRGV